MLFTHTISPEAYLSTHMSTTESPTNFTPPTIEEISELLPAYEVHSFIAQGGMGAVYMASQKSLDRPVAIKVLPRHFGADPEFRDSFEAEAKSMAKLNHPNLIGVYDFGQVDGLLYIIMELVQGKSLYHSAYGKNIAPAEAARIVRDICLGLDNAHQQGILHRDIKPANILLDPNASPKIGDFGLARPVSEHEKDSAFGTPGYTAPEVMSNPQAVDESTDIYAVGVLLYELITGKLPEQVYQPVAASHHCNPQFDQIIRKAIHPTPAMRFRTAKSLAEALKPLIDAKKASNPLMAGTLSASTPTAGKTLLTKATPPRTTATLSTVSKPSSGKLLTAASGSGPATGNPVPTSAPTVKVGSNIPFIRNIIIIIALLAAIYVAWEGKKKVEASRAAENARIAAENANKEKEKQEKIKEAQLANRNKPKSTKPKNNIITPEPKEETPRETLTRLKNKLFRGARSEMPKGTVIRAGRARFYVEDKMSWHRAQAFAEKHGGHLAVVANQAELTTLCSKLDFDTSIWLGAGSDGNGQWCWVDGTEWNLEIRDTSKAACVSVDSTSVLTPSTPREMHSFYIEWLMDGTSPGSLENQLKRCAQSLSSSSPQYPAGSISYDNRHYVLIEKSNDWKSAHQLATQAGGTLATPSNPDENAWMTGFVSSIMTKDTACWIGGLREPQGAWQWSTGEPWEFAKWNVDAPDDDTTYPAACAILQTEQWQDFPRNENQAYFLIEWSKDGQGHQKVTASSQPTQKKELAGKQNKCRALILKIQAEHEVIFTNNIKGYEQELRTFQRNLPRSQQQAYTAGIEQMRGNYLNNRIPADLPRQNMPAKLADILDSRLERQTRLQNKYLEETEDIREKYRRSLFTSAKELKEKGLTTEYRKVQEELDNTSVRGIDFVYYITGQEPELPPEPEETDSAEESAQKNNNNDRRLKKRRNR